MIQQTIPVTLGKDATFFISRDLGSPACSAVSPRRSQRWSSHRQHKPAAPSKAFLPTRNMSKLEVKIKYNLLQQNMKVNPNRHPSEGFLFAAFITCAEGTIASKQFALLNETKTREALLGKIILKNHQQPIQTLQTPILNKEKL